MNARFWSITICSIFLLSCNKIQQRAKWLKGEWGMTRYYQIDSDGVTHDVAEFDGKMTLDGGKKDDFGKMSLRMTWTKNQQKDTFEINGDYKQITADSIRLISATDTFFFELQKQSKNDLHWMTRLTNTPFDGMVWKKIN